MPGVRVATLALFLVLTLGASVAAAQPVRRIWNRTLPPPSPADGWFYDSTVWDDGSGAGPMLYGVGFIAVADGAGFADGVIRWNGTAWEAVGHGVGYMLGTSYPEVHATMVYNGQLIIGGDFTRTGSIAANNIASWNGTSWSPLGSGFSTIVYSLGTYNGKLVAGYDGGVAVWDGTTWTGLGSTGAGAVRTLTVYNGDLIVGGDFTTIAGTVASGLARWNGSTWSAMGINGYVWKSLVYAGELVVGGYFWNAGGVAVNNLARWNGVRWAPLVSGTELNGEVRALAEYEGALVVGGSFSRAGGIPGGLVARWNAGGSGAWSTLGTGLYQAQVDDFVGDFSVLGGDLVAVGKFYRLIGISIQPLNWARWVATDAPNATPIASAGGPYAGLRYQSITLDGSGTVDPDGNDLLYYKWDFGDGASGITTWHSTSHQYSSGGVFNVTLTAFDGEAWSAPSTTTVTITAPNSPPSVSLTSPAANATFTAPASLALTASASDSDGTVTSVEFFDGATSLGTDTTAPFSLALTNVPAGRHTLTARARDNLGAITTSSAVIINVETLVFAVADAHVRDGASANSNFGSAVKLEVRTSTSGNTRWIYLKFETSAVPTVSAAKLRLFGALSGSTTNNIVTAAYGSSNVTWTEATLTWNNKPATGSSALASVTMDRTTTNRWYEWNLTNYLAQEKAAGRHVVTIVLKNTNSSTVNDAFNAKEAASDPPRLALTP